MQIFERHGEHQRFHRRRTKIVRNAHSGTAQIVVIRWDEKAGLRRDAVRSQVIDVLEAQEIKETGNEEG
jgi:hypothetical protein